MTLNLLVNHLDPYEGYGLHAVQLLRALGETGININPIQRGTRQHQQIGAQDVTISLLYGDYIGELPGRQWVYTMWEDTDVPQHWIAAINQHAERLIVPCQHNAELFADCGVTVPIHVVHEGIDPEQFSYVERPAREHYTFMALGDRDNRKGWDTALLAFNDAFTASEPVRLVIKARLFPFQFGDERVSVWCADVPDMRDVYREADCFVFPSRGEGWGLPAREAAATGLPVLATRWSGLCEGIEEWAIPLTQYSMVRSRMPSLNGYWAQVNHRYLADMMRWVYENQEEARCIGRRASDWLRQNQTWTHAAEQMKGLLDAYA